MMRLQGQEEFSKYTQYHICLAKLHILAVHNLYSSVSHIVDDFLDPAKKDSLNLIND